MYKPTFKELSEILPIRVGVVLGAGVHRLRPVGRGPGRDLHRIGGVLAYSSHGQEGDVVMRRPAVALVAVSALAIAGCGADRKTTTATSTAEPATTIHLRYTDVAGDYATATEALLERGREVVGRLLAGDIASVYEQFAPQIKTQVSLAEVERTFRRGAIQVADRPPVRGAGHPPRRHAGPVLRRLRQRCQSCALPDRLRPGGPDAPGGAGGTTPPGPEGHPAGHGAPATSVRRPVVGHRGSHAGDREPPRGGF